MDWDKYTENAKNAIQEAAAQAIKNDNSEVTCEHFLLALLEQEGTMLSTLLERLEVVLYRRSPEATRNRG